MFVGIDVSKDYLDVFVLPSRTHWRSENNEAGLVELVNRLNAFGAIEHVVLEASGGFERACAVKLVVNGIRVSVVNPRQVRDFAKGIGKQAKTDPIDAEVLAFFAQVVRPPAEEKEDDELGELRALVKRHEELVEMRTMEMNRRQNASDATRKNLDKHIGWLNEQIKDVDRDINKRIRARKEWLEKAKLLESQWGIGPKTSAKLIVDLPELGKVNKKKIAALVGNAPYNDDSGNEKRKKFCRGGRGDVRTALYMPTLTAIQHDPKIGAFYERLVKAGKPKKLAIIACMRRIVVILNSILRTGIAWDEARA